MTRDELNFAYKIRHALNETIDNLPAESGHKLASARKLALSRKKTESRLHVLLAQPALATTTGQRGSRGGPASWLGRMGMALPLIVLTVGLGGIYQVEQQRRINEIAEIDAEVLSDDLPLSAYTDYGFNAFLATRGE
jgi:hypothetical protein